MWRPTTLAERLLRERDGLQPIVDLHFHDLRADAIAQAGEEGQDAQQFAGHTDRRTTDRIYQRRPAKVRPVRR